MIYCITAIVVVALVCATRLYLEWLRRGGVRPSKLTSLLLELKADNSGLRQSLRQVYEDERIALNELQAKVRRIHDSLNELTEQLKKDDK